MKRFICLVILLTMTFGLGFVFHYTITPPQYITEYIPVYETVYVDKPVEVIREVPVEVIKEVSVTKEVIKEVSVVKEVETTLYPQRFNDADVAKEWVLSHTLPIVLIADDSGRIDLVNSKHDPRYDCDDYSDDYEALALSENISLWQAPVTNGHIWGIKVSQSLGNHVGLWTKINGIYYYIEPQPVDGKWRFIKIMAAD